MNRNTPELERIKATPILEVATKLCLPVKNKKTYCYNKGGHKNGDRNPSLSFDTTRNRYKCFSCQEAGSVLDLVMNIQGLDFKGAVEYLGGTPGEHKTAYKRKKPTKTHITPPQEIKTPEKGSFRAYSEIYEDLFYLNTLTKDGREELLDRESLDYLQGRGFTEDILYRFSVFSFENPKETERRLREKYSLEELQKAGLYGGEKLDYFLFTTCKIIFPFISEGRIVYLQGREIGGKKLNLKNTPLALYNREALEEGTPGDMVYIVEGITDTLSLEMLGITAVGIQGVNGFKIDFLPLFRGYEVILALDNDKAGEGGIKSLTELFFSDGQRVTIKAPPPKIKDWNDWINNTKKT